MMSWNKMKIKVLNENITTWINGKKMIQISDSKIGEANGSIALQIHDGGGIKVRWRNIRVKKLINNHNFHFLENQDKHILFPYNIKIEWIFIYRY